MVAIKPTIVNTWSTDLVANMRLTGWNKIAIIILQLVLIYSKFTLAMPKHLPKSDVLWVNEDKYDKSGHYSSDRNIQRAR